MDISRSERFILFYQLKCICESLNLLFQENDKELTKNTIDFLNEDIERYKELAQGNKIIKKLPELKLDSKSSEAYLVFQTLLYTSQAFLTENEEKTILEKSAIVFEGG